MSTVAKARTDVFANLREGSSCPCCDQLAREYVRRFHSGMARALIKLFKAGGTDWVFKPTVVGKTSRDESLARHWGLIELEQEIDPENGRRGWWRVTEKGADFVCGKVKIQSHAITYNSQCFGHEGDLITIQEALGRRFDLDELLA